MKSILISRNVILCHIRFFAQHVQFESNDFCTFANFAKS